MTAAESTPLSALYEQDETAWLEAMSEFVRSGLLDQVNYPKLADYLSDMVRRDKREVLSRMAVLTAHLLKWRHQPERRSGSWLGTIEVHRQELAELLESGSLRNYAAGNLARAYAKGLRQAVAETGLPESTFPADGIDSLDALLSAPLEPGLA